MSILVSACVSTVLQSPCVHFTHLFSIRDKCTHALRGSSFATIEKCQTSSSHAHPPSVRRSGLPSTVRTRKLYYQKLKTMVKKCLDQKIRARNFETRNERIKTGALVKTCEGNRSVLRGNKENAISGKQKDNAQKETLAQETLGILSKHELLFRHDMVNHGPPIKSENSIFSRRIVFYTFPGICRSQNAQKTLFFPEVLLQTS